MSNPPPQTDNRQSQNDWTHFLTVEDSQGKQILILNHSSYAIGRDAKCDIQLISQFVSRHHATLIQQFNEQGGYSYRIIDGNMDGKPSSNGLLINGQKVTAHDLVDGDKIVFGNKGGKAEAIYSLKPEPPSLNENTSVSAERIGDPKHKEDLSDWVTWVQTGYPKD